MTTLMILAATTGKARQERHGAQTYTVVPVVALVEGVIHAMNAKQPELVRAATFAPTPPLWNGRPVFLGHPLVNGRPVSGNTPSIASKSIGQVYQCEIKDTRLCMEAWLDSRSPSDLLDRVNAGDPVEVSVGVFVDTDKVEGEHNGKRYLGEWHNMVPDHLALLPAGDIGACSWAAGCGVRAASFRTEIGDGSNQYTVHGSSGTHVSSHAGKTEAKSVAQSHANKHGKASVRHKGKTVSEHYAEQYSRAATGGENEMTKGMFSTLMDVVRAVFRNNDTSDSEVRSELGETLREQGINGDVVDVYDGYFVYCLYGTDGMMMSYWRRDFTKDATGAVASVGTDAVEVEPKRTYEPTTAAEKTEQELKAACSCDKERLNMTKQEITKFLETATEDQLKALSAVAKPPTAEEIKAAADAKAVADKKAVDDKAAADKVIADKAAADKVEADKAADKPADPTFEQLLAKADPDTRAAIQAGRDSAAAKKTATIATLKASQRCDYTDDQLKAMAQADLDKLVKLTGAPTSTSVDFSGAGGPRVAAGAGEVPAPPDLGEAIKLRNAAMGRK